MKHEIHYEHSISSGWQISASRLVSPFLERLVRPPSSGWYGLSSSGGCTLPAGVRVSREHPLQSNYLLCSMRPPNIPTIDLHHLRSCDTWSAACPIQVTIMAQMHSRFYSLRLSLTIAIANLYSNRARRERQERPARPRGINDPVSSVAPIDPTNPLVR